MVTFTATDAWISADEKIKWKILQTWSLIILVTSKSSSYSCPRLILSVKFSFHCSTRYSGLKGGKAAPHNQIVRR